MTKFISVATAERLNYRQQAFSSVDLNDDDKRPGVVFQVISADGVQPSFASIIEHHPLGTILANTEYRLVTNGENDTICYTKGTCFSLVQDDLVLDTRSNAEGDIGILEYKSQLKGSYIVSPESTTLDTLSHFHQLDNILKELDYTPAYLIDKELIIPKKYNPIVQTIHTPNHTSIDFDLELYEFYHTRDMKLSKVEKEALEYLKEPKTLKLVDRLKYDKVLEDLEDRKAMIETLASYGAEINYTTATHKQIEKAYNHLQGFLL